MTFTCSPSFWLTPEVPTRKEGYKLASTRGMDAAPDARSLRLSRFPARSWLEGYVRRFGQLALT